MPLRSLQSITLTGGAGFIGSALARALLKREEVEKLIILDKLTYAGDGVRMGVGRGMTHRNNVRWCC